MPPTPKRARLEARTTPVPAEASSLHPPDFGNNLSKHPNVSGTSPTEASMLVQPTMAEDIEVLDRYLTSRPSGEHGSVKQYKRISSAKGGPVVYLTVARSRKGLPAPSSAGNSQREIIEQILGPLKSAVVELYFEKVHPCFPVIDERTFSELWQRDPAKISSAVMCDIYATALVFWRSSATLCHMPQPDMSFVWNLAVTAVQEDFMGPSMSTAHAALLDLAGRPVLGIQGNVVNCGRIVMLAYSLGIHRDPAAWRATQHEKNIRTRLWWGVRIHDSWSSLAHGTPPLIHEGCHDVPLPTETSIDDAASSVGHRDAVGSFLALCSLTQILSEILPWIYAVEHDVNEVTRAIRRFECALDDWESHLPRTLPHLSTNGATSLWFCFLSLRLLACRLSLRTAIMSSSGNGVEVRRYWLSMLRTAAIKVADFVADLTESQCQQFWLSYTAHLLVSATTMLLRCTIETEDTNQRKDCVVSLRRLLSSTRHAQLAWQWDVADMMLERCSDAMEKGVAMSEDTDRNTHGGRDVVDGTSHAEASAKDGIEDSTVGQWTSSEHHITNLDDLFLPSDSLDFPWETMWDGILGLWPTEL